MWSMPIGLFSKRCFGKTHTIPHRRKTIQMHSHIRVDQNATRWPIQVKNLSTAIYAHLPFLQNMIWWYTWEPTLEKSRFNAIFVHLSLVSDTQLYQRLFPSVRPSIRLSLRPSVRPSVRGHRVEMWENERIWYFLCMFECWEWVWVWMGVGCPCPPVRNDIVTPRHLLVISSLCHFKSFFVISSHFKSF